LDDGRYEVTCRAGHTSVTVLQQQKFEILFEISAHAILDGYYREAVVTFAACLERTYEFVIRVHGLTSELTFDTIDDCWRHLSKSLERQLGAFVVAYTNQFGRAPQLLERKFVELRNDVVHKGKIPSREESVHYGQAVLDQGRSLLSEVKTRCPDAVNAFVAFGVQTAAQGGVDVHYDMQTVILSLAQPDDATTLVEHLDRLIRWRRLSRE
jgi:hypothetical protein